MIRPCNPARPCGRPSCPVCDGVGRRPLRPAEDRPSSEDDLRDFYDDVDRFLAHCEAEAAADRAGVPTS